MILNLSPKEFEEFIFLFLMERMRGEESVYEFPYPQSEELNEILEKMDERGILDLFEVRKARLSSRIKTFGNQFLFTFIDDDEDTKIKLMK